jgi:GDSL-like lipase/acylhydrolase family protein
VSGPGGRQTLASLALALAAAAVTLMAAELALRAAGYVPHRLRATARLVDAHWTLLLDCYPSNPRGYFDVDLRTPASRDRYFHLAPHRYDQVAERDPYAVEVRYNSLRFRDVEPSPRPEGVRRVAIVGDSFTEGQGVKELDTYPRVLEKLLDAGGGGWEVRNCGRRGADFPQLNEAFEDCLRYSPDVVVYAMVLNDADRSPEFQAKQSYVNDWILDRGMLLEGKPAPELGWLDSRLHALVADRIEAWRTGRATARWYRDMYGEPNRAGWERTQGYVRDMNRRTLAAGGRFLVASWPLMIHLEGDDPFADVSEKIGRFCLAAGIPRHELRAAFRGRDTASLWVHPVDMHPNEIAHRLAAESLAPAVRALIAGP